MNTLITLLLVGLLLLGAISMIALVWSIKHAAHGHEDETGFHYDHVDQTAKPKSKSVGPTSLRHLERHLRMTDPMLHS